MLVNGQIADSISIEDRGLLYGDGIFETIICEQGQAILFDQHIARLQQGCEALELARQNETTLQSEIMDVAQGEDCVIKVLVTRGSRMRGYRYDANDETHTRIVYRSPLPEIPDTFYHQGITLGLSEYRLPSNQALAGIKHLNRLDQVLACRGWEDDYSEKIVLDNDGLIIEGTMSNVFIEMNGKLKTPVLLRSGVAGVMRQWLVEHANLMDIEVIQSELNLEDLKQADAIFVCNSVVGIWPVTKFIDQNFPISSNTRTLMTFIRDKLSNLYIAL
ncbi:MAG: aminodeoxychorismate lyase [Pseudomonadota bacterium]